MLSRISCYYKVKVNNFVLIKMKDLHICFHEKIKGYRVGIVSIDGLKFYCVDYYESEMY